MEHSSVLTVLILGASGAVGQQIVLELVKHIPCKQITLITRRKLSFNSNEFQVNEINQVIVENFDYLNDFKTVFNKDIVICALGTTRATSGVEGFIKVDKEYVFEAAKLAFNCGAKQFHLISASNANKTSYFLYPKIKGLIEDMVINLKFPYLAIYRPSLLLTTRHESRPIETVAQTIFGHLDRWRRYSIDVSVVAQAIIYNMLQCANENKCHGEVDIIEHSTLLQLAAKKLQST